MDQTFIEGSAAFASAIIVFVGSVWLILALIMGPRLSYFVTASVTLGFTLILCVVWAFPGQDSALGPVGELPSWTTLGVGEDGSDIEFGPASSYPDSPWFAASDDDQAQVALATELETAADEALDVALEEGDTDAFESGSVAQVDSELTRLLEQDGTTYGAVTFVPLEGEEGGEVIIAMELHPGNEFGPARMITGGVFLAFVAHLLILGRVEKKARRRDEQATTEEGTR